MKAFNEASNKLDKTDVFKTNIEIPSLNQSHHQTNRMSVQ